MQRVGEYMAKAWHWLVDKVVGILVGLLSVLFVLFLAVMFCEGAESYISELLDLKKKKHEVLKFLGIGMGGILLALQAFASHKRAKAMEDAANAQAEATKQQAKANETTEQGLRQERLKNAIEHLGSSSASVRLGGTYELFHLAEDTKEWRQTVLDILCAHIRGTTSGKEYREQYEARPSEEVQSLLTLLFVDEPDVFEGLHINLWGSWLHGAKLLGTQLQRADFAKARLRGATLSEAQLQVADLSAAQLQGADLSAAQLQGANLSDAQLQVADLSEAQLQGANLFAAQLQGANLIAAQLQGTDLSAAQLQGADLIEAQLQGANLTVTQLQGADLTAAQLQGADLSAAQLQGADLTQAKLHGVRCEREGSEGFAERMDKLIGQNSDLSRVTFTGGLQRDNVDSFVKCLPGEEEKLWERLRLHINRPASNELPEDSDAITGFYTAEAAEQWIAEYNEAMSEVPQTDTD